MGGRASVVGALADYVAREWSENIRMNVRGLTWGAAAECVASDGGRFYVLTICAPGSGMVTRSMRRWRASRAPAKPLR